MNFGELKAFVRLNVGVIPDGMELVTCGHYGEVDCEVDELQIRSMRDNRTDGTIMNFICVIGPIPSYPEPD